ncbi:DUF262 domain-containing protein [Brachyspira pilosicoli]|uniref:DUF262 domain-containing protein n=1 Tax=Brachyspira pilosicoli TaxID=52584 RepID=UPI0012F4ACE4|nr:DUF262 domain-containing protein [Brachyspira pilosicoli]
MSCNKIIDLFNKLKFIKVPDYQRAYSWDKDQQINQFFIDIKEHLNKKYYMGHFLFEKHDNSDVYYIIDGQQRLTTIIIFLSCIFKRIKSLNNDVLDMEELKIYESIIMDKKIKFSTVDYDNFFFKEKVIYQKGGKILLETQSQKRISEALDYFDKKLKKYEIDDLKKMIEVIVNANCSMNEVKDQTEAIQMFIYENDRGKSPTDLEKIKSLFMYNINECSNDPKSDNDYINQYFKSIYKDISNIENIVDENDVLRITIKTYYKDLNENSIDKIKEDLYKLKNNENIVSFIKKFTEELKDNFNYLRCFIKDKEEKNNYYIRSIINLGINNTIYPFIVGIYKHELDEKNKIKIIENLENLLIRMKFIGTKAIIENRINEEYKEFIKNGNIDSLLERIEYIKNTSDWWWAYWNNEKLENSIKYGISEEYAKFILWKYETQHLGRFEIQYDKKNIHVEHIAPKTEPKNKPHGYEKYDDDFCNNYIHCLGNLLLLDSKHNEALGNLEFAKKLKTYKYLTQQQEVKDFLPSNGIWGKKAIEKRNKKIVDFVMSHYK